MTNIFLEKMLNNVRNSLVAAVVGLAFQAFRLAVVSEICPIRAFRIIYHLATTTLSRHLSCRTYFSKIKIVCSLTSI